MTVFTRISLWFITSIISLSACAVEIKGSGSPIPQPLYDTWGKAYSIQHREFNLSYKGSSPAEGMKNLEDNAVDFCAIDMPLSLDTLNKKGWYQLPIAFSGVAPIINLDKVSVNSLKLDGSTLADIYLGKISQWNDHRIQSLNPGIKLPNANIAIIYRAAPKGIKTMLGAYLAVVSPAWNEKMGQGTFGDWPANARMVKSIAEMNEAIKATPNSIGYMEISHIIKNKLNYVLLKNRDGNFIRPSDENISATASSVKWDDKNGFSELLVDRAGANTWPISMASFIVINKIPSNKEKTKALLDFLVFNMRAGEMPTYALGFTPIPGDVSITIRRALSKAIVDESGAPIVQFREPTYYRPEVAR